MDTRKATISIAKPKPLNKGASFPKILVGPCPAYCPRANSMKNSGKPIPNNIVKYGIKNVPPPWR